MSRHLKSSHFYPTFRNRDEVQELITDLVFSLVTCVIFGSGARALEASVSTPEVLNSTLGANPVKNVNLWDLKSKSTDQSFISLG